MELVESESGLEFRLIDPLACLYSHSHPSHTPASTLAEMARNILQAATHYVQISEYMSNHSQLNSGMVNTAFCAALRILLKDYQILIAQLELLATEQTLTLQQIWFYLQPSLAALSVMQNLTHTAQQDKLEGGALLSLLYTQAIQNAGYENRRHSKLIFAVTNPLNVSTGICSSKPQYHIGIC